MSDELHEYHVEFQPGFRLPATFTVHVAAPPLGDRQRCCACDYLIPGANYAVGALVAVSDTVIYRVGAIDWDPKPAERWCVGMN